MAHREILNSQKRKNINTPMTEIPLKLKMSPSEGVIPEIQGHENLPPLHLASYSALSSDGTPTLFFKEIYLHMVLRLTKDGERVNNYKGLDKAVKHFEAGDLSQIMTAQASTIMKSHWGTTNVSPSPLPQSGPECRQLYIKILSVEHTQTNKDATKTSAKKEWNFGRPKLGEGGEIEFKERKQIHFDPRHPDQRSFDLSRSMHQLKLLRDVFPKTGNLFLVVFF
ncbi:uncharacterized protein LOC134281464 [Saccostrea cucullata]|uniref:uncharacterized protein LOC134281464 n=1 Tax=Saccostrea cuccullata TaxID=36930 RepID=UPI002ED3FDCA